MANAIIAWFQQFWAIIVFTIGAITLVWNFFSKTLKEIKKEVCAPLTEVNNKLDRLSGDDKLIKDSLLSTQRQTLLDACEKYQKRGWATMKQKDTLSEMYNSYHALGGDSFITEMVHDVMDLPLEEKKKQIING